MTFSIVARCRNTGMFGIAVTSSSPAVAARCAFAEAGVGAVATQNITDPSLGKRGLGLLRAEADALETVDTLLSSTEHMDYRQVMVIDRLGDAAIHSGKHTLGTWGEAVTKNAAAAGNLLADKSVPRTMIHAFEETENANMHLADRLMDALKAGLAAGGEPGLERVDTRSTTLRPAARKGRSIPPASRSSTGCRGRSLICVSTGPRNVRSPSWTSSGSSTSRRWTTM